MKGGRGTKKKLYPLPAALAALGALVLTALLVRGAPAAKGPAVSPALGGRFSESYQNALSAALEGLVYVPKHYSIPAGAPAPAPDRSCYGETADPAAVRAVIDGAAELLGDQSVRAWSEDVAYRRDTALRYYRDDSILALAWQEIYDGVPTTFCEVMISDPSQLRRKLAGDSYGSNILKEASLLAAEDNAVADINGDYYAFRTSGVRVWQGRVYLAAGWDIDSCFFTESGDMLFARRGELCSQAEAERFVSENNVSFSVAFGPILVEDGVNVAPDVYPLGEIHEMYARAAIGQLGERHYLLMTMGFDKEYPKSHVTRVQAEVMRQRGCRCAYALDGGQTATIHMGGQLVNTPTFGWERKVSDILCFASAVPERGGT